MATLVGSSFCVSKRGLCTYGIAGICSFAAMRFFFFFQAEDGIRDKLVTGVQTYALPISFLFGMFTMAYVNIIWLAIYGYYIPANVRVGLSVPQVASTLSCLFIGVILNSIMLKGAKDEIGRASCRERV